MQLKNVTNQTIALAGIAQAAALVQQLATTGKTDPDALSASIGSVLKIDADSVADVFGGIAGVKFGLEQLSQQLSGYKIANPEQARYSASLVFLEEQLANRKDLLNTIGTGIAKAQVQRDQFGLLHENVLANLADIYQNTISTLQPRIMVNGEQDLLTRTDIVNKIRATLLAGIRSAMLWKQCGGSRWKFLFYRKKIQNELQALLRQV